MLAQELVGIRLVVVSVHLYYGVEEFNEGLEELSPGASKDNLTYQEIEYDGYPILWRYYSRIFPAKVIITALVSSLNNGSDSEGVSEIGFDRDLKIYCTTLHNFRAYALDICIELANEIKKYENSYKIKNNINKTNKISIGFPDPEVNNDYKESQFFRPDYQRFMDKFIGHRTKDGFSSILAALGLARCFSFDGGEYITITELGKEFYLLDNPLIDKKIPETDKILRPFTEKEKDLIMERMIIGGEHDLEKAIVERILKKLKDKAEYEAEEIDKLVYEVIRDRTEKEGPDWKWYNKFHNEVVRFDPSATGTARFGMSDDEIAEGDKPPRKSRISAWRAATMGRLVELDLVDWKINSKGLSVYSLSMP